MTEMLTSHFPLANTVLSFGTLTRQTKRPLLKLKLS